MRTKKLRAILAGTLFLLLVCAGVALFLNTLVNNSSVRHYLLAKLSETTGYTYRAGDLKLRLRQGIGFSIRNVVAASKVRSERIEASRVSFSLDFTELMKGKIVPSRIFVLQPRIEMTIPKGGDSLEADHDSVFRKIINASLSELRSASIKQGSLLIKGLPFELKGLDFDVYPHKRNPDRIQVYIRGKAVSKEDSAWFILQGSITGDKKTGSKPVAKMTLRSGKFPLSWIPWPKCLPFSKGFGEADIRLSSELGGPSSAEGTVLAEDVRFSFIRRGRKKDYLFDRLQVDFTSHYSEKSLNLPSLRLEGPDFSLSLKSKFDFKDSSNPHIILKVETPFLPLATFKDVFPAPFAPQWVKEKIYPIISGGNARLAHFSLNGTRKQLKQIRLPENKDVISLKIEWKEMDAYKDGSGLPFEKMTGGLNLERATLSTSITNAVFGNSIITNSALNVTSLYDGPQFCVSIEGLVDAQDLKQQQSLSVMPSAGREFLDKFNEVSGKLAGSLRLGFEKGWKNLRILNGKIHFGNCSFSHKNLYLPVHLNKADLQIDKQGDPLFQAAGLWGRSVFHVSGSTDRQWKVRKAQMNCKVDVNEIIGHFSKGYNLSLSQNDLIPLKAAVARKQEIWSIQGETNLDDLTWETDSISLCPSKRCEKGVFDMEILPGDKILLNNFNYSFGKSAFVLNGSYDLKLKDIIRINMTGEKFHLEDLGIRFKNENAPTKGIVSCRAEAQVSLKSPSKTTVSGILTGNDVSLDFDRMPSPITDCMFEIDFSEKNVSIRSFNMRMGESLIDIHGDLLGWDGLKGKILVNANPLNVYDFIPKKTGLEHRILLQSSFVKNTDIRLNINASRVKWQEFAYGPLRAEGFFRSGDFHINAAEAQMEHGTLSAKGYVRSEKGPDRLFFSSEIKFHNQPVEDLEDSLGLKRGLEGPLTMEAQLSSKGGDTKGLISGLTGSADFFVEKGRIKRKRGIVSNVLEFLNLQNIIHWRMPDFSEEGLYFESLEAHVNIKEGTLETQDLIFKSPVFNATAQGTVSLPTKLVDAKLWVQTLETMDSLVSKVPIIGYILTEKENSPRGVLIYPLEVKGPWADTEINSSVLKNLAPGVINIFKRILLTPGHIFKEISEMTSGNAE